MDFKAQGSFLAHGRDYRFLLYSEDASILLATNGDVAVSCPETVVAFKASGEPLPDANVVVIRKPGLLTVNVVRSGKTVKVAEVWTLNRNDT